MTCEELCKKIQNNIDVKSSLEQLYLKEKKLIEWLAKKHYHNNDYEDLCQIGYLGLDEAAKTYDPETGLTFSSYAAMRIEWYMIKYRKENSSQIRIPLYMYDRVKAYKRFISNYCADHGNYPDSNYIMKELHFSNDMIDEIERVINMLTHSKSLDEAISSDSDDYTLADVIPDPNNQIELKLDEIERTELRDTLIDILDSLHGREPEILKKRYFEDKTSTVCGKELGISAQRVSQIEHDGLKRIRDTKARVLQPYIEDIAFSNGLKDTGLNSFKSHGFESSVERDVIRLERYNRYNKK